MAWKDSEPPHVEYHLHSFNTPGIHRAIFWPDLHHIWSLNRLSISPGPYLLIYLALAVSDPCLSKKLEIGIFQAEELRSETHPVAYTLTLSHGNTLSQKVFMVSWLCVNQRLLPSLVSSCWFVPALAACTDRWAGLQRLTTASRRLM
ncbi:hypothetical protein RRG08_031329 [Elysia crispata]|uniref:Uncharacterized protein n=1 Tax=Elysia crispata TaxID=231223 RepID=A0AAE0YK03_9GAST|nr:hypothetical protein RRG08_031329 [Elysia crispata]